jgi:hypothetical protein
VAPLRGSLATLYAGKFFVAVSISFAFTWSGVKVGSFWISRAAAPLTIGAAMLVPLRPK